MAIQKKGPGFGESKGQSIHFTNSVDPNTQAGRVLHALRQQPMSAAEIQWGLRIAHAPAAVRYLRARGYQITSVKHPRPSGQPIQRYHLIETD